MKILVAGSSSGIGKSITELLLANQHEVIGLARNHEKFSPKNHNYYTYPIDFSRINDLEKAFKLIRTEHAEIANIICCVGYGEFAELEQFSIERIQAMMNVNFISQVILLKTFIPTFKKRKSGKVILIGSECALEGEKKASIYSATKFALRGFSQSLRKECAAANISVSLINPGLVATPFFDRLNFSPAEGDEFSIQAEQIASLVYLILQEKTNLVYEEINLQPIKKGIKQK